MSKEFNVNDQLYLCTVVSFNEMLISMRDNTSETILCTLYSLLQTLCLYYSTAYTSTMSTGICS